MAEQKELINRVAQSGLKTIKLETYLSDQDIFSVDLKPFLFQGLLLREKEFRAAMKSFDWSQASEKVLCTFCSSDAIIPKWAYMLVTMYAQPFATTVFFGDEHAYQASEIKRRLQNEDWSVYTDQRVILKGCSDGRDIPADAYVVATQGLLPFAKSIMYGEPCSTVPVYKRKK